MYQKVRPVVKIMVVKDSLNQADNSNQNGAGQSGTGPTGTSRNDAGRSRPGQSGIGQSDAGQGADGRKVAGQSGTDQNGAQTGNSSQAGTDQTTSSQAGAGQNGGERAMTAQGDTTQGTGNQGDTNQGSTNQGGESQDSGDPGGGSWPPGFAVIEGNPVPVSLATAKRLVCAVDTQELIVTPEGGPLDLGRTKRLFDRRQHEALAARDGGCMWPECGKPPSWSEAHHINEFERDHGNTDVVDGICLCRFHHLTLHNNGWKITRTGNDFWLIPPATLDPKQTPIPMPSKNLLIHRMRKQANG
jgi:hypothetical protein